MFSLQINTDNAAFQDGERPGEIARILRDVANGLSGQTDPEYLRTFDQLALIDLNGHTVGKITVTD